MFITIRSTIITHEACLAENFVGKCLLEDIRVTLLTYYPVIQLKKWSKITKILIEDSHKSRRHYNRVVPE
jgi:hypothetical protein